MLVSLLLFAAGAEVEIFAINALVSDSNDRVDFAAVTVVVIVYSCKSLAIIRFAHFWKYFCN
jgi:divalent metal cation (Fe/Co/Zn/Cd) transporter